MASKLLVAGLFTGVAFLLSDATATILYHPKLHKVKAEDVVAGSYFVVMAQGQTIDSSMESHVQKRYEHLFPGEMVYWVKGVSDGEMSAILDSSSTYEAYEDAVTYATTEQPVRQTDAPWGLDRIDTRPLDLDGNYDYKFDGTGVTIFIADNGVLPTHQEFTGRFAGCTDFTGVGCDEISGDSGLGSHGTHVAGTAAGTTYGVAKGAQIYDLRVLGEESGEWSWFVSSLEFVMSLKMTNPSAKYVINASLGGSKVDFVEMAVNNAVRQGLVVVTSAGNDDADACDQSPAGARLAITVASSDIIDARSSFSNWGPCVDVFAPGSDILSAGHTSDTATATKSGTSMASPHVAGFVATLLQQDMNPYTTIASLATPGVITDVRGSPNLMLFNGVCKCPDDGTVVGQSFNGNCNFNRCLPTACPSDVFFCPTGNIVKRELPHCDFADCPPMPSLRGF